MKMQVIKWDENMAMRCLERVAKGFVPAHKHHEKSVNKIIKAGEWDEFTSKINKFIVKQHK